MKRFILIILSLAICLPVLTGCTPKRFKDLKEGDVKCISVTTLPEFYGYEYHFTGDEARVIVDYLSDLNLTPRLFGLGKGGLTWVISIEYEDGSVTTVYQFDDEIRINDGAWYNMKRDEADFFEALIENLSQK